MAQRFANGIIGSIVLSPVAVSDTTFQLGPVASGKLKVLLSSATGITVPLILYSSDSDPVSELVIASAITINSTTLIGTVTISRTSGMAWPIGTRAECKATADWLNSIIDSLSAINSALSGASIYKTSFTTGVVSAVPAASTAEIQFAVSGVKLGDVVRVNKPSYQPNLIIGGVRVIADSTTAITFLNNNAALGNSIVPANENYGVSGVR